jgi:hypothetical protein
MGTPLPRPAALSCFRVGEATAASQATSSALEKTRAGDMANRWHEIERNQTRVDAVCVRPVACMGADGSCNGCGRCSGWGAVESILRDHLPECGRRWITLLPRPSARSAPLLDEVAATSNRVAWEIAHSMAAAINCL